MATACTKLDQEMRLLLDVEDTRYILLCDVCEYHRISGFYYATDRHLTAFLATLIHQDTKGARSRVNASMRDRCDWRGFLLPTDHRLYLSLCEAVLQHPFTTTLLSKMRESMDKAVLGIDGQYSTLLSVLYQAKHGGRSQCAQGWCQCTQFSTQKQNNPGCVP